MDRWILHEDIFNRRRERDRDRERGRQIEGERDREREAERDTETKWRCTSPRTHFCFSVYGGGLRQGWDTALET